MIFYFHTPVTRNFCGGKSYSISLAYESAAKACRLIERMEAAFKDRYDIKFSYPNLSKVKSPNATD
jgi:hypothetical protein